MPCSKTEALRVAFLDSGTGGIPYMIYLKEKCPSLQCVYLGDTANFPYGEKSETEVCLCAEKAVQLILDKFNPDIIVIACNTISVSALADLRQKFPQIPFVGTVPAIKLAASVSENHRIGLLATRRSVESPYTEKLIADFASDCFVAKYGDPDLISFIEKKLFNASEEEKNAAMLPSLKFFKENDVDTIILGCTHFLHMAEDIKNAACAYFGKPVKVVDSRDGVARQTIRVLSGKFSKVLYNKNIDFNEIKDRSSSSDMTFFMTGAETAESRAEYEALALKLGILYGGAG